MPTLHKSILPLAALLLTSVPLALGQGTYVQIDGAGAPWRGASSGTREKVLEAFDGSSFPEAGLIWDQTGNLYGTTYNSGGGTVFELSPTVHGWTETVLYGFCALTDCADGAGPHASVVFDKNGNLYGTTNLGGNRGGNCPDQNGCGVVFELSPTANGWTERVLYAFCSVANCADGEIPNSNLIFDSAGNLYGSTFVGGTKGNGTVFELIPGSGGAWQERVLHSFTGTPDGELLYDGVIFDGAGNLYGTAFAGGGYSSGAVFELTPTAGGGWTENVIYSFPGGHDGANPDASLIFDSVGNLYGTTFQGGYESCSSASHGCGVVFELTPGSSGWTESVLHFFRGGTDGALSESNLVLDSAGNLYGTTAAGGSDSQGTVFALTPESSGKWRETQLHVFTGASDGGGPIAGPILDSAGNLYGTTYQGGNLACFNNIGCGVVFELHK